MMKVIIDPYDNILYKSFYIYALQNAFGRRNVSFDSAPFSSLSDKARKTWSMRFIIIKNDVITKYCIACNDSYEIIEEIYDWCDVYGGVNINFAKTPPEYHDKLVSLCPSFGINPYSIPEIVFYALRTISSFNPRDIKKHFGTYKRLFFGRPKYKDYEYDIPVQDNYVFFCSTLWYNDEWNHNDEGVNNRRANFIRACHEIKQVNFEGGFVSQGENRSSIELFADCLCQPYSMKEWMENTKKSICVFNTPAFWDCHGWKLGEYLALGKAIISTKLSNDLPSPLVHGENIHYVDNSIGEMKEVVEYIVSHPTYREKLEKGARQYWERYGTLAKTLGLLGIKTNE